MSFTQTLIDISLFFSGLSLVAVGGANVVVPEMHQYFVVSRGWVSETDFVSLVALSQVAPGPNVLIVSLLGWKVAGLAGALVATASMCGPSSLLAFSFMKVWRRHDGANWQNKIKAGLVPVTIGLILASGYVLVRSADESWGDYAITAVTIFLALKTKIPPLLVLGAASLVGYMGWL